MSGGSIMGLTVHYSLRLGRASLRTARAHVVKLRRRALKLSFRRVDPVLSYRLFDNGYCDLPDWFRRSWELSAFKQDYHTMYPEQAYAFLVHPGRGSETCSFGLLRFPRTIRLFRSRIIVKMPGWYWQDFCKTQYASNPRHGGFEN